jgi:hypothetical protein
MSGEILCLENQDNCSFVEQLGNILQVSSYRIYIEKIDEENYVVFVNDEKYEIQKYYGGTERGLSDENYEMYFLRAGQKNDQGNWVKKYDMHYYFERSKKKFVNQKDISYRSEFEENFLIPSKVYYSLTDALYKKIYNDKESIEYGLFQFLLDEIPKYEIHRSE